MPKRGPVSSSSSFFFFSYYQPQPFIDIVIRCLGGRLAIIQIGPSRSGWCRNRDSLSKTNHLAEGLRDKIHADIDFFDLNILLFFFSWFDNYFLNIFLFFVHRLSARAGAASGVTPTPRRFILAFMLFNYSVFVMHYHNTLHITLV